RCGATRPRRSRGASRISRACRSTRSPCRSPGHPSGSAVAPTPGSAAPAGKGTAGSRTWSSPSATRRASTRSARRRPPPGASWRASPPHTWPSSPSAAITSRPRPCGRRRSRSATRRTSSPSRGSTGSSAPPSSAWRRSSAFAPPAATTSSSTRSAPPRRSASRSSASRRRWCPGWRVADLTGGQLVARVLKQAGVGYVFTLCGGHILPIYDGCLDEGLTVIDTRHEQAAAHCADAYARLTRGLGVAMVAPGPGVTDAVTGVANAFAARSPMLLIGGAAAPLTAFATRAGVPVFMSGAGRGALPAGHPNAFAQARSMALARADVVVVLGTPLDFRLGYGRPPTFAGDAKVVMVDVDPAELGRNRPLALGLVGDLGVVLRQALDVVPTSMASRVAPWLAAVRAEEVQSRQR